MIVLVSDAGPGIPDPDAAMARGRGSGSDGSTGLGLDIVRRLAESTGGDVRIGSSVLGGTEVRIWVQLDGRGPGGAVRRGHRGGVRRGRKRGAGSGVGQGSARGPGRVRVPGRALGPVPLCSRVGPHRFGVGLYL